MSLSRFLTVLTLSGIALAQTSTPPSGTAASQAGAANGAQATSASSPNQVPQKSSNPEAERERSGVDPLLDPPPLPDHPATLVGGTVAKLDRIRDRMAVRPFGGGSMDIAFDMRTKIYRDGQPGTVHDLKPGSRVSVDTMLNGDKVFARSIRVHTQASQGDAHGQVIAYDSRRQILTVREEVSPQPVKLRIDRQTTIQMNGKQGSLADLQPGALVVIRFQTGADKHEVAQNVRVLASPGATFTFAGTVTFIDLRARRMAIDNRTDNENYDILMESVPAAMLRGLKVGSDATVKAVFDGQNYRARTIEVASRAADERSEQQ